MLVTFNKMRQIAIRRELIAVLALIAGYVALFGPLAILRHATYHSFGDDLGIFDQIFWNTTQGRPFESTISLGIAQPHSFFGDHFSPIYWILYPFYFIFPHPETLLVIQILALGAGALPIYLLARSRVEPGLPRLAWVLIYFLSLPVAYNSLWDFHETNLAVLPLGLAIYFLETRRMTWFIVCLLVTFLIKEEMPLIGIGFGAYILLGKRNIKLGAAVLLMSLAIFSVIVGFIIPAFAQHHSYGYVGTRYSGLGSSWRQIVLTLLTKPITVAKVLLQRQKIAFLIGIFGPVLGLSFLARWAVLLLLPTLGYLLLSSYPPQYSFTDHYAVTLVPLVLATAILAIAIFSVKVRMWLTVGIVVASLIFSCAFGDMPFSRHFNFKVFRPEARYNSFQPTLQAIPSSSSVSAENNLTPHLTHRRYIYTYEYQGTQHADYVALDYAYTGRDTNAFENQIHQIESEGYQKIAGGQGLALLKKRNN